MSKGPETSAFMKVKCSFLPITLYALAYVSRKRIREDSREYVY